MTSRFNILYRGSAADAAAQLETDSERDINSTESIQGLRLALINALQRIDTLEGYVRDIHQDINMIGHEP
jgi:hypothetical protein